MIRICKYGLCLVLWMGISLSIKGQFVNLKIKIEPEISATVEQNLGFGTQVANSGITQIQLGDLNMGVFSIKAFHTQNLYLSLEYPDALTNELLGSNAKIPLDLKLNYNNSGKNEVENSIELPNNQGLVSVHDANSAVNSKAVWQQIYLYVYGSINIGNVPNGVYAADIILSIDYD